MSGADIDHLYRAAKSLSRGSKTGASELTATKINSSGLAPSFNDGL